MKRSTLAKRRPQRWGAVSSARSPTGTRPTNSRCRSTSSRNAKPGRSRNGPGRHPVGQATPGRTETRARLDPPTSGSGYSNNGGNSGSGAFRRENPARGKKCHYCKKMNHFQRECKKRLAENGQMVSPPKGVSEQRTADDPDGYNCHPFSQQGQQLGPMESLFGSLN